MTPLFIVARNRPIYLWACLDALYRFTRGAYRATLIDVASDDPLVSRVIDGFSRRGLLSNVITLRTNQPHHVYQAIRERLDNSAPWFAYVEADAVVCESSPCWLDQMTQIMRKRPRMAMLGSAIDKRDFVQPEEVSHLRERRTDIDWSGLLKTASPERLQAPELASGDTFSPHTPAGRLLLLRTRAVKDIEIVPDSQLAQKLEERGWETGVATRVFHRHLSLLHVFDEPGYDVRARDEFMSF